MTTMSAQWTDPDGQVWQLTDASPTSNWFTPPGPSGWDSPPYEYTLDPLAGGGETVRSVRNTSARITWPLHIWGDDHPEFVAAWRQLRRAFTLTSHRAAPGTLRVTRPDGTAREIECYYEEGFAGAAGEGWLSANPVVSLLAPDGYWRDTTPVTEARSFAAGSSFLAPFPTVSSAQVLGAATIDNPGEVEAWPTWTITGPASVVTATNYTTGKQWILSHTLNAGELAIVTTRPPTVRGPAGENLVNDLNWPEVDLWPLDSGLNSVDFSVAGAASGTAIELTYYPRYEGA